MVIMRLAGTQVSFEKKDCFGASFVPPAPSVCVAILLRFVNTLIACIAFICVIKRENHRGKGKEVFAVEAPKEKAHAHGECHYEQDDARGADSHILDVAGNRVANSDGNGLRVGF